MNEILKSNTLFNYKNDDNIIVINKICGTLLNDGLVIAPCDTIYGILALPRNEDKVRSVKKRDEKPFLYLISDISQLSFFNININLYKKILDKNWPGNITFIMSSTNGKNYGIRMPQTEYLIDIINRINFPLISTSVNFSGESFLSDPQEIINNFSELVSLIVIDESFSPQKPSTIVDITGNQYKILRKGDKDFIC